MSGRILGCAPVKGGVGGVSGVVVEEAGGVGGGVSSGTAMGAMGSLGAATGSCCGAVFLEQKKKTFLSFCISVIGYSQ